MSQSIGIESQLCSQQLAHLPRMHHMIATLSAWLQGYERLARVSSPRLELIMSCNML